MPTRTSLAAARTPRSGTALLVLAGLLWGTGGLAGSVLASQAGLQPVAVAAYRLLVGGALITAYAVAAGRLTTVPLTRAMAARVTASGVLLAVFQAAYFAAVEATSVGLATLTTMVAVPVLVTAGTAILDRRLPTRCAAGSILIAVGGLVLLLGFPTSAGGNRVSGTGLALIAAFGFALLTLDRRTPLPHVDRATATGLSFLAGGLLLLPIGLASGMQLPLRVDTVATLAFLGLVPTSVAYISYFAGLQRAGATAGVVAVLLEPLTATLLAALFAHENLSGTQILGALLLLVSIAIQQVPTR